MADNKTPVQETKSVFSIGVSQELADVIRTGIGKLKIAHYEQLEAEAKTEKKSIVELFAMELLSEAASDARDAAEKRIAASFAKNVNTMRCQGFSEADAKKILSDLLAATRNKVVAVNPVPES